MSELQLGLIGLGTVGVLAVVAYNKWQEMRHRKLAERVLQSEHEDVLLGANHAASEPSTPSDFGVVEDEEAPSQFAAELPPQSQQQPDSVTTQSHRNPRLHHSSQREIEERREPVLGGASFSEKLDVQDVPAENGRDDIVAEPASPECQPEVNVPAGSDFPSDVGAEIISPVTASPIESVRRASTPNGDDQVPAILVSPAIDYVASFELVEPVAGDQILRSQRQFLSRITKPIGWAGYNDRSRDWEEVVESGNYRRLRVGLLLADRRGPLGEADLLTFHGAMQNLADELMAVAELPDRDSALNAALALDQFCADVDIQLGLNVISQGQVFPGTKIRALAEAAGMVLDASGRFVRSDDDGRVLYMLANQESAGFVAESMKSMSTHGLVFILDVPCVSHGDRVFAQMLDLARRMAETLHGVLVDDNRQPLTETMLEPFRRQIAQYQSQLAARGLPAGSPLAQRLFN